MDTLIREIYLPCITQPTRVTDHSATLIDHINIYRPLKYMKNCIISGNLFEDISDHLPNFIIIKSTSKIKDIRDRPNV